MRIPIITPRCRYHVADANTIALWQGAANKNDSSGNGLTLNLGGGTERYGEIGFGLQGFMLDGASFYKRGGNDTSLNIVGDITIEALVRPLVQPAGLDSGVIVTYGVDAVDVGNNDNTYWEMAAGDATEGGKPNMAGVVTNSFLWETGAGVNNVRTSGTLALLHKTQHWAWVRTGTTLIPYLNGFAQPSFTGITLGTAGGAPAQVLSIGARSAGGAPFTGVVASVKISNVARAEAYIRNDAIRCLGTGAGILDGSGITN